MWKSEKLKSAEKIEFSISRRFNKRNFFPQLESEDKWSEIN